MEKLRLAGCVILKDDAILLIKRIKKNWYELPGGKIEDETEQEAAIREIFEEVSVRVRIIKKLGRKDFEENGYQLEYNWFLAQIIDGKEPSIGEPEKCEHYKYIPLKELRSYNLSPNMQNFLEEFEKGNISLEVD
jgi:8-oxo-dGTP pyrophosphatase MutT (NUDIX family)